MMKSIVKFAAVALAFSVPAANAAVIKNVGDNFTVDWFLAAGKSDPNGNYNSLGQDISAEAEFTLSAIDWTNDTIDLTIRATNTTIDMGNEVGMNKLGFGITPNATTIKFLDVLDGEFVNAVLYSAPEFPNAASIDITSNTKTGAPKTLREGEVDEFVLRIGFAFDLVESFGFSAIIDPFAAKFQTAGPSFEIVGRERGAAGKVPEPQTLALLGLGLIGLAAARKKKVAA